MPAPTPAPLFTPRAARSTPRQRFRRLALLSAALGLEVLALGYLGLSVSVAVHLMAPDPHPLTQTPAAFGLLYQTVSFPSRDDHLQISGWLMTGELPDGTQT